MLDFVGIDWRAEKQKLSFGVLAGICVKYLRRRYGKTNKASRNKIREAFGSGIKFVFFCGNLGLAVICCGFMFFNEI